MAPHNYEKVIVPSGDYKSADPAVATLNTHDSQALRVGVDVSALSGSGCTVTVTISGVDEDATLYTLLTKAITGTGLTELVVGPGIPTASGAALQAPLPRKCKVACVGSGTRTTLTYAVSAEVN